MMPTNDDITKNKTLTSKEKADIQQFFIVIVNEMKKHGVPDIGLIKRAFEIALEKHGDTRRKTGEPYIFHPLQVAKILADCGYESDMIAAAILHDVMEDCGVTKNELENKFSANIADIVDAVTKVSTILAPEETISKLDLDNLSDTKFLTESARVGKAVYIKCADRIHNLRTISIFTEEKQKEKAYHTRNVIIPVAKKLHIHNFVDILGKLCLRIEDPTKYQIIQNTYNNILNENRDTLFGPLGLIEKTREMILEDGRLGRYIADVKFSRRTEDSINADLIRQIQDNCDIGWTFTKETVPLFDVYFIASDLCMKSPEDLFFSFYDKMHTSAYKFTIVKRYQDDYENYYIMRDWFGNMYRLFIQSETEYLEFVHGLLVSVAVDDFYTGIDEVGEANISEEKMIPVFKKDGTPMMIPEGSTILDFAFAIDPNIGICAKYAFLNGSKAQVQIYRKLKPGDMIEVVADHDKEDQLNDTPHAIVRWFEYLHTKGAIKSLSRWLEKHMDSAVPSMVVYDENGVDYEIDMAVTVLDFAFCINENIGLHVKKAYLNKAATPVELDTTLRYGDKVRFEYDLEDTATPVFTWLGIVKTKYAKERLIDYFDKKFNN